jgi:hypothetical protein
MTRFARPKTASRPLAIAGRADAETDARPRITRAPPRNRGDRCPVKIVGDFVAAHCASIVLRDRILYVRVLQPALHYELEQISKPEILRKLKQRFGGKTIRDIRFRLG